MYEELLRARQSDLALATRTIERRIEWEQLLRIDRLERALKVARGRLHLQPTFSVGAK
ncbi:MAG: hypothetical protein IPI33_08970 [Dehalococcoidia bacterium]|jgi:hypothetical protein|uniref:hypothetical protein n=1 Tax=Candidatus Amarobacter glycogenicus TaxID=3140699 RepID=UPI001D340506|nr:hypothetical protein [Dehalococcoidia bacterium]MBK6563062.1 hypothetical protein [Dehalococcoidia bacterium]MBK7126710.1 hypothetical protein [Dehalococcoidia bacterium]MBK7329644.1 hypothetical protein [Dehalococcoidia bacterium]MBK7725350.1 hypothetical protein [Dehalococcoidia bacterium]